MKNVIDFVKYEVKELSVSGIVLWTLLVAGLLAIGGFSAYNIWAATTPTHAIEVIAEKEEEEVWYKYYTSYYVQNGDTLWDLAGEYMDDGGHYTRQSWVKEVIGMNSLNRDGKIMVGQHLSVPYYSTEYVCY